MIKALRNPSHDFVLESSISRAAIPVQIIYYPV